MQQFVTLHNTRICLYAEGNGLPLLLLHGGGIDSAMLSWAEAIPPLAQHFRVIAPDWPGYGASSPYPGPYRLQTLVEFIPAILDALEIESAALVGSSMGGGAALGFALAHPQRVRKLVLVDSYGLASHAPFHSLSYAMLHMRWLIRQSYALMRRSRTLTAWGLRALLGGKVSAEVVEAVFEAVQDPRAGESFYAFQVSEMQPTRLRTCYQERLHELPMPVLIMHGERDQLVPVQAAHLAAQQIPNARLHVLPEAGHWLPREQPAEFNRLLLDFLREE